MTAGIAATRAAIITPVPDNGPCMQRNQLKYFLAVKLILFSIVTSPYAHAQVDTEKATRETDRIQKEQLQKQLLRRPEVPAEPFTIKPQPILPDTEEKKFFVKKIVLQGCESFKPEEFAPLLSRYENTNNTVASLNKLARELEQEYLNRGVIAAALVPEQHVLEQTVTIRVVEARMGKLITLDQPYFRGEHLHYYWRTDPGEIMRYDKLYKSVQLMNKNPDRTVKAALKAGAKPGTTDVILTADTQFPVHAFFSLDNEGTAETGKYRKGIGLRHNNFLGLDDILLGGYSFGKNFSGKYLYHNLPVTGNGMSLVYGYSVSESHPKRDYSIYGISSEAKNASMALRQDIYTRGEYAGEAYADLSAKDKTTALVSGTNNRDRLRILSLGGTRYVKGAGSAATFSLGLSQGLPWLGASEKNNPLASRNAKAVFTRISPGAAYRKLFASGVQGSLKCSSQFASRKLAPQEEFALGGINSVRGYPSSDYLADNAFLANLELVLPPAFIPGHWRFPGENDPLRKKMSFVLFSDYGWGERKGPLPTEKSSVDMWSAGLGWRIKLFEQVSVRLEWGFPLGNEPLTRPANSSFHFSLECTEKILSKIKKAGVNSRPGPSAN